MTETPDEVLLHQQGRLGRITLNRPRAINALTLGMVHQMRAALREFWSDPSVDVILIDGAGERGLCAGGDVRAIYDAILAGDDAPKTFWREEYLLNAEIRDSVKPVVALMDGVVMGGGVGISAHARHRVVTERSSISMPEVGIGFSPDVGATFLYSRSPHNVGVHAALTAARLGAADALYCGVADHFVTTDVLPSLVEALAAGDAPGVLSSAAVSPPAGELAAMVDWIDECYGADDVEEILDRLDHRSQAEASAAAASIRSHSPTAVLVAFRALRQARDIDSFQGCLDMEYQIACHFLDTHDFREGIRAAVIDKDRQPAWHPATLADVTADDVDPFFRANETPVFGAMGGLS